MIQKEPTCWGEDGHATIVCIYLYLYCIENMKTSVGVVKKHRCHEKYCRGGCPVVQQACSKVCTSLKYQSDLQLSVAVLYR